MTNPRTLVLATNNPGKATELRALLAPFLDLAVIRLATPTELGVSSFPEETGATFAENARLKASALASLTGMPALADDSGLCVDALGGNPGVQSARWAGPAASDTDRMHLLLQSMSGIPEDRRTARFVCAAAVAMPNGTVFSEEGTVEGLITETPHGSDGFGYDPIFLVPSLGRTFAELGADEKNRISHRGQAVRLLQPYLASLLSENPRH